MINVNNTDALVVRTCWNDILNSEAWPLPKIIKLFYEIMWTDHPETRKLFSPEREAVVRKKFEQMMPIIMSSVDDLSRLTHIIHRLALKHLIYGVHDSYYNYWLESLLKTFGRVLGDRFTTEIKTAWTNIFKEIIQTMQISAPEPRSEWLSVIQPPNTKKKKWLMVLHLTNIKFFSIKEELVLDLSLQNLKSFGIILPAGPGNFGFELILKDSVLMCYVDSEQSLKQWIYEIDWRHDAVNRLFNL